MDLFSSWTVGASLASKDEDKNTISLSFLFEVISELNIVMELISSDVSLNISRLLADIRKALVSSGCLPSEIGIRVRSQDSDTLVLDGKVVKRHGWRTTVNFFCCKAQGHLKIEYIDEDDRAQHFCTSVATERKCIVTFLGPLTLYTEDVV